LQRPCTKARRRSVLQSKFFQTVVIQSLVAGNLILFAFSKTVTQAFTMTKPLALIFYESLLPGSQLVNRLQDLGYRVQMVADAYRLQAEAEKEKPIVILADLFSQRASLPNVIQELKANPATKHIPILAFTTTANKDLHPQAQAAGADLIALDSAVLAQLPRLLDQVLQIEL
jgi:CheY-like chemotaxis protein